MNNDSMIIYLAILIGVSVLVLGVILFRSVFFSVKNEGILKLIQQKNYDDAIKNLRKLVQKDDSNPFAHCYLGEVYFLMEHYDWALPHFRKVIQLNKYSKDVQEVRTRERLAEIFLHYKQLEEAQKELLLILKLKPNDYNCYYRVGEIFYQRHYPENAGAYYQKALGVNPNHVDSLFRLGEILYHSKKSSESLDHLKQCIKINPACSRAHYYIGMICLDSLNYNQAAQEFSLSVRDAEYRIRSLYQKGRAHIESGHSEKGIVELERGLFYITEEDNASLALRYLLAKAYETTRDLSSALEQWEQISQINPEYRDVKKKLNDYSDLRMDDHLKDILTASDSIFESLCLKIVECLGLETLEIKVSKGTVASILAIEPESKWRSVKRAKQVVKISRTNDKIAENVIRQILSEMKDSGAVRGACITTGEFSRQCINYAESRPIQLYDRTELSRLLNEKSSKAS